MVGADTTPADPDPPVPGTRDEDRSEVTERGDGAEPAASPPTLASLARAAAETSTTSGPPSSGATPPASGPAPSPRPAPPAPTRQGPPPAPARRTDRRGAETTEHPDPQNDPTASAKHPSSATPPSATSSSPPPAPPPTSGVSPPPLDAPGASVRGATPPPPPPPPAGASTPPGVDAPRSANPPPAPPPPYERPDLDDILERLHDDLDGAGPTSTAQVGDALTDPRDVDRPPTAVTPPVESTGGIDFRPTFAGFTRRAIGLLVDLVALGVLVAPGVAVAAAVGGAAAVVGGIALSVVGFVLAMLWYGRSVARSGRWIGNRVTGTRVVDVRNGDTIGTTDAAARFAVRHLVSIILLLGFLVAFADPQRRTFHDRFAGSIVVGRDRQTWRAGEGEP